MASYHNDSYRGNFHFLTFGLLITLILLVEVKYPKFFFMLRHARYVKEAEPSEYYKDTQILSIFVLGIAAIVLFILAL